MSHSQLLESVAKQFTSWRTSRHKGQNTPISLKEQAVALKSDYPVGKIVTTLGINHSTLKRWSENHEAPKQSTFISLPAAIPASNTTPSLFITCEFPNGILLTLTEEQLNNELLSRIYDLKSGGRDDPTIS